MRRIIIVALLVLSILSLAGCSLYSSKDEKGNLEETVKTAVSNGYVTGEMEGLLSEGTFQSFDCYKVGNTVVASARYYDLQNESTNIACFQLPEGFCPRVKTTCNGYIVVDGATRPVFLSINTNGVVSIEYSNSIKMSQIFFSATFPA